jgi:hypothetical protein
MAAEVVTRPVASKKVIATIHTPIRSIPTRVRPTQAWGCGLLRRPSWA